MKKSIVILWLSGLLVLCFGLSFMVNIVVNTYLPPADFNIVVLLCGPLVFFLMGFVSWAVFYFLQKKNNPLAAKIGLLTFTALVFGTTGTSIASFAGKSRERNEHLHLLELRKKYLRFCVKEIESFPAMNELDPSGEKTLDFCLCVFEKTESNPHLRKVLLDYDEPEEIPFSAESEKIKQKCYDEYFFE